jgi:hypothetical protein
MATNPLERTGGARGNPATWCNNGGGQNIHGMNEEYGYVSNNPKKQKTGTDSEKEVDLMLSKALMDLRYEDRTAVEERIHGIGQEAALEETAEMRQEAIRQFNSMLEQRYDTNSDHPDLQGYHLAKQNQFSYTVCPSNEMFRLRFIRAERYVIGKAVDRFCKHLNFRLFCFGLESLQRPLELDDLRYDMNTGKREATTAAYKYFKTGSIQVLPGRDRAGRRVVFHHCDPKGQSFMDEVSFVFVLF